MKTIEKILIVDDDPTNVKLLAAKLGDSNYTILKAYGGQEALQKVKGENPDLVLLDVMMPGMNGFEVSTQIKSCPETADIPMILVTALDGSDNKTKGLEAGADDFLNKPVHTAELKARVRSLLRLKRYSDQLKARVHARGMVLTPMRTLSDGMMMNIKVEGPKATAAYEDGKKTFFSRKGQLNFACSSCHVQNAGVRLRSELISPAVGHAVHWPVFRGGDNLVTLQNRYVGCFKQVRAVPPAIDSSTMNNLEYFHSALSNGLPMKASVFRK